MTARAGGSRKLQRERRDAAAALDEHRLAGPDRGGFEQRVPRGNARTGQRRSLFERVARRNLHPRPLGQHDFFREHAVERSAKGVGMVLFRERAVEPRRKERRRDAIADREPLHAAADFDHLAGAVRCRHDSLRALLRSASDHQVAIVQRHRAHADAHIAGPDARPWAVDQFQRVEAVFRMELECFHS